MDLIRWLQNLIIGSSYSPASSNYEYYFPEEILIEILCKLPVDQARLFKSVCHSWKSIISSPNFVNIHLKMTIYKPLNHYNNDDICMFMFTNTNDGTLQRFGIYEIKGFEGKWGTKMRMKTKSWPGTRHDLLQNLRLIGSCDGLLFFDKLRYNFNLFGKRISFYSTPDLLILNPITRETRVIEHPIGQIGYLCGIFFDKFRHEHTILHVTKSNNSPAVYHIFNFIESGWKRINVTTATTTSSSIGGHGNHVPPCMHTSPPVIVSDALHWIVDDDSELLTKTLMAFKIETNEIHYFPHPKLDTYSPGRRMNHMTRDEQMWRDTCPSHSESYDEEKMQLMERNGKLCFSHIVAECGLFDMWILEEYGDCSSWVMRFKVKLPHNTPYKTTPSSCRWGSTILSFPHKDVIVVRWTSKRIYLYNLVTHKSINIGDGPLAIINLMWNHHFVAFNKTLLSPNIAYKSTFQCH